MNISAIQVKNITKKFWVKSSGPVTILRNVSFDIPEGQFTIIFGPSGCGKSTLLHTILGLETPDSGQIIVLGHAMYTPHLSEDQLIKFRKNNFGMIYQQPNWIKALSVVENISFPLQLIGVKYATAIKRGHELLETIHLHEYADYYPSELSSGQQQRVALARALISNPPILIADEPTGNLDYQSGVHLLELLADLNRNSAKTIVMVTHDLEYLKYATTAIEMFDGQIKKTYPTADLSKCLTRTKGKKKYEAVS